MTRILLSPSAFYPSLGGVEEICRNLAKTLIAMGHEVVVAVNRHPATLPESEIIDGIPIHRFAFEYPNRSFSGLAPIARFPFNAAKFLRFVQNYEPDIVHVICPSSNSLYCCLAKSLLQTKLVVTLQGEFFMDANAIYQRSVFARFGASQLLNVADAVTACSKYVLNDAKKRFQFVPHLEEVVFNGVDLKETAAANGIKFLSKPFIFGIGRLVENKGFDSMLRAFAMLRREDFDVDMVIAGAGDSENTLKSLTASLELTDRVHFVGRQDRAAVAKLFENSLFFVLPSPVEPFGIVCLEAMRAGKPVVSYNSGGPAEFIEDEVTGLLVPPGSIDGLFAAMQRLCRDEDFRTLLGNNAFKKVQSFDWQQITLQYTRLYQEIL